MSATNQGSFPRFIPAGDAALVVEFGRSVSRALNKRVRDLDAAIRSNAISEVTATIPAYTSVLIYYDPNLASFDALVGKLQRLLSTTRDEARTRRRWILPVCYGGEIGFDLEAIAQRLHLSTAEIVTVHAATEYMIYMIGFSPGFAYLGELPAQLSIPRKSAIVPDIPPGTIQIGGVQTAISSMPMPTGWYIIGRTPVMLFDIRRKNPFLLEAGDFVRFVPIKPDEFHTLAEAATRGEYTPESTAE
jgi:KipI family sensor histidine kinase inhibitor